MSTPAQGARARARAAMREAIIEAANEQLATVGPAALSVRAVARDVGMASSAIYRHVASRDELLTLLLIDGYEDLGAAIAAAEHVVDRADIAQRFRAAAGAVRSWALAAPHRYALLYGSPVPDYAAPQTTIEPATRGTAVFAAILVDAHRRSGAQPRATEHSSVLDPGASALLPDVPGAMALDGVLCWAELFGLVSFELFGHLVGTVRDGTAFFTAGVEAMVERLGLASATPAGPRREARR